MDNLFFEISEFVKLDGIQADIPIRPSTAHKILEYHLIPLNGIRGKIGLPIYIRSGFRPKFWELANGRDGTSQHCFRGLGASDISLEEHSHSNNKPETDWLKFFELLKESPYKRIAYYPELRFFHCDYKSKQRQYFRKGEKWVQETPESLAKLIRNN